MVLVNPLAIQRAPKQGRVSRRPVHNWNVRHRPWTMQPVAIAPVIPGETLKNAVLQARVVTDPVKNRLIGWWHEYHMYYVPFRAMTGISDELTQMVIDPEWTSDGIVSNTAVGNHYFAGRNSVDYLSECMDRIVEYDFRLLEETTPRKADGLHLADINRKSIFHSVLADSQVADYDVAVVDGPDAGSELNASEVEVAMQQYELLRSLQMIEMTYEDYLKTYGIKGKAVEPPEHQFTPEALRYVRDWSYPANTVDGEGNVSSALSWSVAERIDKDRFFREPGFIVVFSITRPKVYLENQVQYGATMMDTIRSWLPKVMENDPYTSLVNFAAGAGPMATGFADTAPALSDATPTQGYWVDVRDLLLHGDQFINHGANYQVPLPAIDGNVNYVTDLDAMCQALFVDQTGAKNHTEQDGSISMVIMGSQRDHTVDSRAQSVLSA